LSGKALRLNVRRKKRQPDDLVDTLAAQARHARHVGVVLGRARAISSGLQTVARFNNIVVRQLKASTHVQAHQLPEP
jgi:hypothetical protein